MLGRSDYQWIHEPILYGWKEGAGHYFINDRTQATVLMDEELDLESMKKKRPDHIHRTDPGGVQRSDYGFI